MKKTKMGLFILVSSLLIAGGIFGSVLNFLKNGKNVEVNFDDNDLESALNKTKLLFDKNTSAGSDDVNTDVQPSYNGAASLNSAEVTALASRLLESYPSVKNPRIRLYTDSMVELSITLGDDISDLTLFLPDTESVQSYLAIAKGSNLYLKCHLYYEENNHFNAEVMSLSVGQLQIPNDKADALASSLCARLTNFLDGKGITIQELKISEDTVSCKAALD